MSEATQILEAIEQGDPQAAEQLLPVVYEELRRLAAHKMAQERPGQTLQATALVHEAYLRLVGPENQRWQSSAQFFLAAAEAMRRILIEKARQKGRQKREGSQRRVELSDIGVALDADEEKILLVDEAVAKLATHDRIAAELIKLRFFTGLPNIQAARMLGCPDRTAKRTWAYARAWLHEEIAKSL